MQSKHKAWIFISLLTLVTALIWLGVSVRSTLLKSTVSESAAQLITPLDSSLDQSVIDNLKNRSSN